MIFGSNMTSLNFTLSRTAGREFAAGRRDPRLVAGPRRRRRAVARARPRPGPGRPPHRAARRHRRSTTTTWQRSSGRARGWWRSRGRRTRSGRSSTPPRVCRMAHDAGALAWIDAVHYAAHEPIDVRQIDADVLICSPYKFCGPHLGMAYGRAEVIERWRPYKARPAPTHAARAAVRDRDRSRTSCSRASIATLRLPGLDRRVRADRSLRARRWASGSCPGSPTPSRSTAYRAWRAACRRS